MRLRELDPGVFNRIARELAEMAGEIAEDPHPEIPLEDYPEITDEEWPEDSVAVEIWRLLTRAEVLAMSVAIVGDPRISSARLAEVWNRARKS